VVDGCLNKLLEIIHQDGNLLVVNKPAGLVCHPTKTDEFSSLISRARLYLGSGVVPQLVNRLDRETSGVTVIALDPDTARELRREWENRLVQKEYLAIVHGHVSADRGLISAPLGKDTASRVAIKDCVRPDGLPAETEFEVLKRFSANNPVDPATSPLEASLLRIRPRTGRKHQIRIHLAHYGHPIVGDKLYGGDEDLYLALVENRLGPIERALLVLPYQALHASAVSFQARGRAWSFAAKPEPWFTNFVENTPCSKS